MDFVQIRLAQASHTWLGNMNRKCEEKKLHVYTYISKHEQTLLWCNLIFSAFRTSREKLAYLQTISISRKEAIQATTLVHDKLIVSLPWVSRSSWIICKSGETFTANSGKYLTIVRKSVSALFLTNPKFLKQNLWLKVYNGYWNLKGSKHLGRNPLVKSFGSRYYGKSIPSETPQV